MSIEAPRFVEPCSQTVSANCAPRGYKIAKLVAAQATTNYIAYGSNTSGTSRIYIARMDSDGRFATPGASTLSVSYAPTGNGLITSIDVADMDNDGHIDIAFSDHTNNRISIVWNSGTVDAANMPIFSTQNDFSMPASGSGRVAFLRIVQLRPDATNSNKKDIIAVDIDYATAGSTARIAVFLAQNACSANCSGTRSAFYSGAGSAITAYTSVLAASSRSMINVHNVSTGYFNVAPGTGVCPSIVFAGRQDNTNDDYVYFRTQTYVSSVCTGDFSAHVAANEKFIGNGNWQPGQGIATADLTNDNISDIAITLRNSPGNSAAVRVYIMPGGDAFPTTPLSPYLPTTTSVNYNASNIIPYCLDGSTSCSFPSLIVTGNRGYQFGPSGNHGFISLLPNKASSPWFDDNNGSTRIDYAAPGSPGGDPIAMPLIGSSPTRNDVAMMGWDQNGNPFYSIWQRNGTSTSQPFKSLLPMRSFPDNYLTSAEVGTIKLIDLDGDVGGDLEILNHLVNQTAISSINGNLAEPDPNSMPAADSTVVSVTHAYPVSWHMQRTMDTGDFNNDGFPDVAITGYTSRAIGVSLNDGAGGFLTNALSELSFSADLRPQAIVVDDFDQDGLQDIITGNYNAVTTVSSFSYLRGKGNGAFETAVDFFDGNAISNGSGQTCNDVRSLESWDINGDGRPELVVLCYGNSSLFVARRHTNGTWVKNTGIPVSTGGANGTVLRVGRLASTTGIDMVIGGLDVVNSMRVVAGVTMNTPDSSGNFTITSSIGSILRLNGYLADAQFADLDEDGYGDIVTGTQTQNSSGSQSGSVVALCKITGATTCTLSYWGMDAYLLSGIAVGDINGDLKPDIVVGTRSGNRIFYRMISRYLNSSN